MDENKDMGFCFKAFLKKIFFVELISGLGLTLRYMFSTPITLRYPDEEKWIPYKRFRGRLTLNRDDEGRELCVACELCSMACPTDCITVIPMEDDSGRGIADRVAKVWQWNSVRCLYCGYCQDACPTTAVRLGRDYELACLDLDCTLLDREELLEPHDIPADIEGGVVVRARFERGDGVPKITPDFTRQIVWWPERKEVFRDNDKDR